MIKLTAQKKIVPSFLFIVVAFFNTGCGEGGNEVVASGRLYKQSAIIEPTPTATPVKTTLEDPVPIVVATPEPTPTVILVDSPYGENVERWRSDVRGALAEYGLSDEEDRFMRVMWCESRGDPDAVNAESGASGLMQHIPRYWDDRARSAGFQGASPFDPIANIYASVWLLDVGGWSHWECK
tara:strand:- start:158 stop:703 length:546 start_codon:yes stop_codon:yes gene_type:complete